MALAMSRSAAGWKGLTKKSSAPTRRAAWEVRRAVVGGHDDHPDRGQAGIRADPGADGVAVDAGHLDIEQHQVGPDGYNLRERVGVVPGGDDLEALQPQVDLHETEDVGVVLGHEHGGSQHASLSKKLGGVLTRPPRAASSAPARPTSPCDSGGAGPRRGCPSVATTR